MKFEEIGGKVCLKIDPNGPNGNFAKKWSYFVSDEGSICLNTYVFEEIRFKNEKGEEIVVTFNDLLTNRISVEKMNHYLNDKRCNMKFLFID